MMKRPANQTRPTDTEEIRDLIQASEEKVREFFRLLDYKQRVARQPAARKRKKTTGAGT